MPFTCMVMHEEETLEALQPEDKTRVANKSAVTNFEGTLKSQVFHPYIKFTKA